MLLGSMFYLIYRAANSFPGSSECGMSVGPIYGRSIVGESFEIEQIIEIPDGYFGLNNLHNDLSPQLIKFDENDSVLWAVEFEADSTVGIPYKKLSEMDLRKDEYGVRLSFFNQSYGEPGAIYLAEDYELEYMCLSPM